MRIGILSGFGSAAGAYFFDTLVKECQKRGCIDDWEFPEVILYNIPTKGTDPTGIADETEMYSDLVKGMSLFETCKVKLAVIACNTAHIFYNRLQEQFLKVQIVHVPRCAMVACNGVIYGVLSTRSTRDHNLYGGIHATDDQQEVIERCIDHGTTGDVTDLDRRDIKAVIDNILSQGAKKIILGCTEIPLSVPKAPNIIDAGEEAIKTILDIWESDKIL